MRTREQQIEKAILEYLRLKNIFAWKAKTVGTFDPARKIFRKHVTYMKGVSDILGIFKGRPLAIEVKNQNPKTYPNQDQKAFLDRFNSEGGIGFVARSIEDVAEVIEPKLKEAK